MPTPSQAGSQDSEGVETRRHPSKSSNRYDEGIVQGVMKITQTGILWSQVQVLVGPPEKQTLTRNGGGFVIRALPKVTLIRLAYINLKTNCSNYAGDNTPAILSISPPC